MLKKFAPMVSTVVIMFSVLVGVLTIGCTLLFCCNFRLTKKKRKKEEKAKKEAQAALEREAAELEYGADDDGDNEDVGGKPSR